MELQYLEETAASLFLLIFQLRVRATDGGYIPCVTDNVLTVNVLRNEFAPAFFPNNRFEVTILETQNVGQPIYTVSASDNDRQVRQKNTIDF